MSAISPSPKHPVRLVPISVAKPWGREIWYSAIERRGESRVLAGGVELPLSTYLQSIGLSAPVILLKVLDPHPEPVRGDLYFEVHREKREVYVVTAIDRRAWPDGRGQIRFGMNQTLRRQFADDERFRSAYLSAVREYEDIRRQIDGGEASSEEDLMRSRLSLGGEAGNPANDRGKLGNRNNENEPRRIEEAQKRAAMDAFTDVRNLVEGDVVVVPTWIPHALQHGVRVVEFQTPSYERYIISFAQKVLTQDGWDSEYAIARLSLDPPPEPKVRPVAPGVETIASFDDFGVWRASVEPGRPVAFPADAPYALCMAVRGTINIGPVRLRPEEACLVPAAAFAQHRIAADTGAQCLIAAPGL